MTLTISHLSTTHQGGAGIAARRLNDGLVQAGIDSTFVSLHRRGYVPRDHEFEIRRGLNELCTQKFTTAVNLFVGRDPFFSVFSDSLLDFVKDNHTSRGVLHIHNYYNLLRLVDISKLAESIPVVLTLHDQRVLTGGCHYSLDCHLFTKDCGSCPNSHAIWRKQIKRNRETLDLILNKDITFVTPSQWMYRIARQTMGSTAKILHIPNVLNSFGDKVRHRPKQSTISKIGFAANQSSSLIKGTDVAKLLASALSTQSPEIQFVRPMDFDGDMTKFWASIEALFVPSRADNLPNVITEAHLNGVPVIARAVGGIPEMIFEDFDAVFLDDPLGKKHFIDLVDEVRAKYTLEKAQKVAMSTRELSKAALAQHIQLYQDLQ
jgi:glycosyltransferase involved in cell wall biosynthesis